MRAVTTPVQPTASLISDYIVFEKIFEDFYNVAKVAENIFNIEPEDIGETYKWQVRFPRMCTANWAGECDFGRRRWYDTYPTASDVAKRNVLRATAPSLVAEWDKWQHPQEFISLLTSDFMPAVLARKHGSNLAALQLIVDMWDHFQTRDKFLPLQPCPSRTASLYLATSLLRYVVLSLAIG